LFDRKTLFVLYAKEPVFNVASPSLKYVATEFLIFLNPTY